MQEFWNFHDSFFLVRHHWVWMLVALGLGIWVGWYTSSGKQS